MIAFLKGNHVAQFTNIVFVTGMDVPSRKFRFEVSLFLHIISLKAISRSQGVNSLQVIIILNNSSST